MKTKYKTFFALLIFVGAFLIVLFLPSSTFALTNYVRPWDVKVVMKCENQTYVYQLSQNLTYLSQIELRDRLVYCSTKLKAKKLRELNKDGVDVVWGVCYLFPNIQTLFEQMQKAHDLSPTDATITFNPDAKQKFVYTNSIDGKKIDLKATCWDLIDNLKNGNYDFALKVKIDKIHPNFTTQQAKNSTVKRGEFTTDCSNSPKSRQQNIALALSFFNGLIVDSGQTVSFNQIVGKRTAERGFGQAKVLVNGKYVDGVGGGVCQASTTLFNALLKSNVKIDAVCQHSSKSAYVNLSFDAMVNDQGADLVFTNDTNGKLYFCAGLNNGKVTVQIFGNINPYTVLCHTKIIEEIDFNTKYLVDNKGEYADKIIYDDQTLVLSKGVKGARTEGWLEYVLDGKTLFTKKIRTNYYKPIDCVVIKGANQRPQATP